MKLLNIKRSILLFLTFIDLTSAFAQGGINFTGVELLCRPTNQSITLNVVADQPLDAYAEYGTVAGTYTGQTSVISSAANSPVQILINGLQSNTRYYYRLVFRKTGTTTWLFRNEHSFYTQRPPGNSFSFDISSDSHVHVGGLGDSATWRRTLTNVANDNPDFLLDCGDTFNMDTTNSSASAQKSYIYQRSAAFFGVASPSVPIFIVVGNHEEQEAWHLDDFGNPANSQPVWGTNQQKKFFPNPVPDNFYSGDASTYFALSGDQLREDYYAWEWGNALFVVIDPFWFTTTKPFTGNIGGGEGSDPGSGNRWDWTLGDAQYNWLVQTLENSHASYKFLFMHHMTGGTQDYIRGGAYAAPFCEWGGYNTDGVTYGFNSRRPSWAKTIHQALVDNHVSVVFHGHDHQYAYEKRDGIVYQSLPAAGFAGNGFNIYSQSNPLTLRVLPSPGHLHVTVSPATTKVDYISSNSASNGTLAFTYSVDPSTGNPLPVLLQSYTAQVLNEHQVLLKWTTATEFQNEEFIIQRASQQSGVFTDIGKLGAQNSPGGSDYHFVDEPGMGGTYLYRLIQQDMDGKQTSLGIRRIILSGEPCCQVNDLGGSWQLNASQPIRYVLSDLSGRILARGELSGSSFIAKPLSGSIFILRILCNGSELTKKLIK